MYGDCKEVAMPNTRKTKTPVSTFCKSTIEARTNVYVAGFFGESLREKCIFVWESDRNVQ